MKNISQFFDTRQDFIQTTWYLRAFNEFKIVFYQSNGDLISKFSWNLFESLYNYRLMLFNDFVEIEGHSRPVNVALPCPGVSCSDGWSGEGVESVVHLSSNAEQAAYLNVLLQHFHQVEALQRFSKLSYRQWVLATKGTNKKPWWVSSLQISPIPFLLSLNCNSTSVPLWLN